MNSPLHPIPEAPPTALPGSNWAWRARAAALARTQAKSNAGATEIEIVEFLLAGERHALELGHVVEVCPVHHFTILPCAPPFVLGIMNVRGRIVAVMDLKRFFGMPSKLLNEHNRALILANGTMETAILADQVIGARRLRFDSLQPPPATLAGVHGGYVRGFTDDGLALLDGAKILADPKLVVREEVGRAERM